MIGSDATVPSSTSSEEDDSPTVIGGPGRDMLTSLSRTSRSSEDQNLELLATSSEGSTPKRSFSSSVGRRSPAVEFDPKTSWSAISICSMITTFTFVVIYMLNVNSYNYLLKIDSTATVRDQGWLKMFCRVFTSIAILFSSMFAYASKTFRPSVGFGAFLMIVGSLLYGLIECFPEGSRTMVWIVVFSMYAAAEGTNNVLTSFIPRVSSQKDRSKAYGMLAGAEVMGIVFGPIIQGACLFISGETVLIEAIPWVKVSRYTVPIWIAVILSIINMLLVIFIMREPPTNIHQKDLKEGFKTAINEIRHTNHWLFFVCTVVKLVSAVGCTTILTLAPPYIAATANADEQWKDIYTTSFQMVSGCCAFFTVLLIALCKKVAGYNSARLLFISLCIFAGAYVCSIPFIPFLSHAIVVADDANPNGCDVTKYAWCADSRVVTEWAWIPSSGALIGIGFCLVNISHDTYMSKFLGGIDQNILQGSLQVVVNFLMGFVPLNATSVFKNYGPTPWWCGIVVAMVGAILLWFFNLRSLEEYIEKVAERDSDRSNDLREEADEYFADEGLITLQKRGIVNAALGENFKQ